jgi:hypothetical protein
VIRPGSVDALGMGDLRLLKSRPVGPSAPVPIALSILVGEGDFYRRDLLIAVTQLPDDYWQGPRVVDPVEVDDVSRDGFAAFMGH